MTVSGTESAEGKGEQEKRKETLDYQIMLDCTSELVRFMETTGWCVRSVLRVCISAFVFVCAQRTTVHISQVSGSLMGRLRTHC